MIRVRKAFGLWCPVCQTKNDRRKIKHIDKRREERAWKKDMRDGS